MIAATRVGFDVGKAMKGLRPKSCSNETINDLLPERFANRPLMVSGEPRPGTSAAPNQNENNAKRPDGAALTFAGLAAA